MRVAAITRILNESDIVESFVRHNAHHFDHHIFLDNGSTDGTLDILNKLIDDGFSIEIHQNKTASFNEVEMSTFLFYEAAQKYKADWVYCLDADEFIDDRDLAGGLSAYLSDLLQRKDCPQGIKIPWSQYVFTSFDDQAESIVPLRMTRRFPKSKDYKVIMHGSLAKKNTKVDSGAHNVLIDNHHYLECRIQDTATLAHYSERSSYQHISKFVRGWARVLAAGAGLAERGIAYHYKAPFDYMTSNPGSLLRNQHFMTARNDGLDLIVDPIRYLGGPLKYTNPQDEMMRAISGIMGYIETISQQHGRLIDEYPQAKQLVAQWNAQFVRLR